MDTVNLPPPWATWPGLALRALFPTTQMYLARITPERPEGLSRWA